MATANRRSCPLLAMIRGITLIDISNSSEFVLSLGMFVRSENHIKYWKSMFLLLPPFINPILKYFYVCVLETQFYI